MPSQLLEKMWLDMQQIKLFHPVFLFFASSLLLLFKLVFNRSAKLNLPPSPPKLPIIGNLHQLGSLPHRSLQALSKKYGPLMLLHVGHVPTLVVSSTEMAREMMKTHDIVFSNRSKSTAADILTYGCKDIGFSPYGDYWRQVRKIGVLELLSAKRVESFQFVREEEVSILINKIKHVSFHKVPINLSEMLVAVSNNIVSRCVLGRKAEEGNFGKLSRRVMSQFTDFSFGDLFPYLAWMDILTGLIARLKATSRGFDAVFDRVIEEYKTERRNGEYHDRKDFAHILFKLQEDGMLDIQLTPDNLKGILMDMIVGGTDTTSTTMEWAMAELLKNPNTMKKAQEEIRRAVGKKSKLEMKDINQMDYLNHVIKETLRLHPAAPLLPARETSASVKLGGYDIPAKTKVLVNIMAIQSDPKFWDQPDEFNPERFANNPVDYKGQDFQFIPFGGGRRGCPGITFGVASVEYLLANLLYWFDWKMPNDAIPQKLDMSEENGMTVRKKIPLHLIPMLFSP